MPDYLGPDPCIGCNEKVWCDECGQCEGQMERQDKNCACGPYAAYAAKRALLEALKAGGVKFDNHGDPEGMSYDQFDAWLGQIHGPGHLIFIPEAQG